MSAPALPRIPTDPRQIAWEHLRALPFFRALVRAHEAALYAELGPLPTPVLDIGTGDGHFAFSVWGQLDVGLDLDFQILKKASQLPAHRLVVQADGTGIPFVDGCFSTVVANSALEHVGDLEGVLRELSRVLRPGGRLLLSVPTPFLTENLGLFRLLNVLGARGWAKAYGRLFARIQRHNHQYEPEEWEKHFRDGGFVTESTRSYFSPESLRFFDLGHGYGLPNLLWHTLTGCWVPPLPRFVFKFEERFIAARLQEPPALKGGCVLFVLRRP